MFVAITWARWRSAVNADPLISRLENIPMSLALVDGSQPAMKFATHHLHSDPILHLCFRKLETLALQVDVVPIWPLHQVLHSGNDRGSLIHAALKRTTKRCPKIQVFGFVVRRIYVGNV